MSMVEPSYWADVMEAILSVACQSLVDTPLGMPSDCYVGHSRPPADCCDALVVYVEHFRPTVQFPNEFTSYDNCQIVRQMMDVVVLLRRPCWPVVVDDGKNPFPAPSAIDAASTNLLEDIQALWGGLVRAYDAGALIFTPRPANYIKWGRIVPLVNMGGCAGWELNMTIDLDECA